MTEVILLERIVKLGQMGDTVKVKPGYARNYLLPQGKALRANEANKKYFEAQKAQIEARNLERRKEAQDVAERMKDLNLIMVRQAGEGGQLYGSVSAVTSLMPSRSKATPSSAAWWNCTSRSSRWAVTRFR